MVRTDRVSSARIINGDGEVTISSNLAEVGKFMEDLAKEYSKCHLGVITSREDCVQCHSERSSEIAKVELCSKME